jgi:hypothetical protein
MLLCRGQPGDNDKALELLAGVRTAAKELGFKALADNAQVLKLAAEAVRRPLLCDAAHAARQRSALAARTRPDHPPAPVP